MSSAAVKILLIEDDVEDARLALRHLSAMRDRFTISHAESIDSARQQLAQETPDLVLLDLGLPDGVGTQNVAAIRSSLPQVPIIVLSGWDEAFTTSLRKAGADDFLPKVALNETLLVKTIEFALERAALVARIEELENYEGPRNESPATCTPTAAPTPDPADKFDGS